MYFNDCNHHWKNNHNVCCDRCKLCNPKLAKGLIQSLKDKIINLQNESIQFKFAKRPIKKKQKDYYYLMLRKLNGLDSKIQNLESLFHTHFDHNSDDLTNNICSGQSCEYFEFYDSVRSLIDLANKLKEDLVYEKQNVHCNYENTSQICNHIKLLEMEIRGLSCILENLQNPGAKKQYFTKLEKHQNSTNKVCNTDLCHDLCPSDNKCSCISQNIKTNNKTFRRNGRLHSGEIFKYTVPQNPCSRKDATQYKSPNSVQCFNYGSCRSSVCSPFNYRGNNNESSTSICSCNICRKNTKLETRNNLFNNPTCAHSNSCCSCNLVRHNDIRYRFLDHQNNFRKKLHHINSTKQVEFIDVRSNRKVRDRKRIKKPFINQYDSTETLLINENIFTSNEEIQVSDYEKRKEKVITRNLNKNFFPESQLTSTDGVILKHVLKRNKKPKYKSKSNNNNNVNQENNIPPKLNSRVLKNIIYYELSPRYTNKKNKKINNKEKFNAEVNNVTNSQNNNILDKSEPNKGNNFRKVQTIDYTIHNVNPNKKGFLLNDEYWNNNTTKNNGMLLESDDTDSWTKNHKQFDVNKEYHMAKPDRPQERKKIKISKTTKPVKIYKNESQYVQVGPNENLYYQWEMSRKQPTDNINNWKYTRNKRSYKKRYYSNLSSDEKGVFKKRRYKKYYKQTLVNESDSYETIHSSKESSDSSSTNKMNSTDPDELIIFMKNNKMSSAVKQSDLGKIINTLSDFKKEYCDNCVVQEKTILLSSENLESLNDKWKTNIIVKKEIIKCTQCRKQLEDKILKVTDKGGENVAKTQFNEETDDKVIEPTDNRSNHHKTNSDTLNNRSTIIPTYQTTINPETLFSSLNQPGSKSGKIQDVPSFGNTINININRGSFSVKGSSEQPTKLQNLADDGPCSKTVCSTKIKRIKPDKVREETLEHLNVKNTDEKHNSFQIENTFSQRNTKKKNKLEFEGISQKVNPSFKININEGEVVNEAEIKNMLPVPGNHLYGNGNDIGNNMNNDILQSNIDNGLIFKETSMPKEQINNMKKDRDENVLNKTTNNNPISNVSSIKKKQQLSNENIIQLVPQQKGNVLFDCQNNMLGYHKLLPHKRFYQYSNGDKNLHINHFYHKPYEKNKLRLINNICPRSFPLKLDSRPTKANFKRNTSIIFNVPRKNSKPFKNRYKGPRNCNYAHSLKVIKEPDLREYVSSNCYNGIVRLTMTSESSIGVSNWLKIAGELKEDKDVSNHLKD